MKSKIVLRFIGFILVLAGLLFPVQGVLELIKSIIGTTTKIRPEWIQDLESVKIVLVILGVIIFALTFIKTSFSKKKPHLEVTGSYNKLVLVMLFICLLISGFFAFRPVEENIGSFYQDDFFYFLKIAENTLKYGEVTLDGTNVTNGFQPLWMIIIMLLTALISDKLILIKLSVFLLVVCHVATAYLLYKISVLYKHEKAGTIIAFFWAFNPFAIGTALSGFETSLYLLLIAISVWYYLKNRDSLGYKQSMILGLFLGLTFWARLDAFFLVAAIGFDYLIGTRKKIIIACKKMAASGIVFSMFAIPWFLYSWITSKTLTPISGTVKTFVLIESYSGNIAHLILGRIFTLLAIIKQSMAFVGMYFINSWYASGFLIMTALAIGWLLLIFWLIKKASISPRPVLFLVFYSLTLFAYYIITSIDVRYVIPVIMFGVLGTGLMVAKSYHQCNNKKIFRIATIIFLIFIMASMSISAKLAYKNNQLSAEGTILQLSMYDMATGWMSTQPKDTVFAGVNSGVYAYFSGRKVVNLDGVISNNAYHALKEKRLYEYIHEQEVDYVVDWDYIEDVYLKPFGGEGDLSDHLTPIRKIENTRKPERYNDISLVIYRVNK